MVADLVVAVAVLATYRARVPNREPKPPALLHGRVRLRRRPGRSRRVPELRHAVALAVRARVRRLRRWSRRTVDVDHHRGAKRDPRPEHEVHVEVTWREISEAADVGEPLHGDPAWRRLMREANLPPMDERLQRLQDDLTDVAVKRMVLIEPLRAGAQPVEEPRPEGAGVAQEDAECRRPSEAGSLNASPLARLYQAT